MAQLIVRIIQWLRILPLFPHLQGVVHCSLYVVSPKVVAQSFTSRLCSYLRLHILLTLLPLSPHRYDLAQYRALNDPLDHDYSAVIYSLTAAAYFETPANAIIVWWFISSQLTLIALQQVVPTPAASRSYPVHRAASHLRDLENHHAPGLYALYPLASQRITDPPRGRARKANCGPVSKSKSANRNRDRD